MNLDMAIVVEETQFPEFVHKKANARSGRADNFRQCCLADVRTELNLNRTALCGK
jgi:hypothetical protein